MSNESNKRLKQIRENLRYSQNDFAEIIGTKETKIRNIENGRSSIDENIIKGLVEKFNININWLFIGNGEMFLKNTEINKKIINGDKNMINVNAGGNNKNSYNDINNYNSINNNSDNRINELIDIYKHLPPIEQEKAFYRLKLQSLEVQDN